jgi:hypothetical protein
VVKFILDYYLRRYLVIHGLRHLVIAFGEKMRLLLLYLNPGLSVILEFFTVVSFCLTYEESTEDLLFIDLFDVLRGTQICIHVVLDVKVDT